MSTIEELARAVLDGSAREEDVKELAEQALRSEARINALCWDRAKQTQDREDDCKKYDAEVGRLREQLAGLVRCAKDALEHLERVMLVGESGGLFTAALVLDQLKKKVEEIDNG